MKKATFVYSLLFLVFLSSFVQSIYNLTLIAKDKSLNKNSLIYSNESKIDYQVYLKENDFIEESILPSRKTYITDLVEKITMDFEYKFSAQEYLSISKSHRLTATIVGIYNENPTGTQNPVIWEKEFEMIPNKQELIENGNTFSIKESFEIDLSYYNAETEKFKEKFAIPTVAYLEIKLPVSVKGSNDKYVINEINNVVAKIPLSTKVFHIDASSSNSEEKSVESFVEEIKVVDSRRATSYGVLLGLSLVMMVLTLKRIPFFYSEEQYKEFIDGIKKEYDEIIVETDNMIAVKEYKPIMISNFKEMINLAQSLETPIILYEKPNFACFYIVSGAILYLFLVKDDNRELKKAIQD